MRTRIRHNAQALEQISIFPSKEDEQKRNNNSEGGLVQDMYVTPQNRVNTRGMRAGDNRIGSPDDPWDLRKTDWKNETRYKEMQRAHKVLRTKPPCESGNHDDF